ncbi:MAG: hypothetical protein KDE22_16375 [Rhodobacterales bacterium]|nr:hypothetical protein [Rhodobacterales bacterium]
MPAPTYRDLTVLSARAMLSKAFVTRGLPVLVLLALMAAPIMNGMDVYGTRTVPILLLLFPVLAYFISRFVVTWTRFLIHPEGDFEGIFRPVLSRVEWKVYGTLCLFQALTRLDTFIIRLAHLGGIEVWIVKVAGLCLSSYLIARLVYVIPAAVMGDKPHFATSWRLSANTWSVLVGAGGTFLAPLYVLFNGGLFLGVILGFGAPVLSLSLAYTFALGALTTLAAVGYGLETGRLHPPAVSPRM